MRAKEREEGEIQRYQAVGGRGRARDKVGERYKRQKDTVKSS